MTDRRWQQIKDLFADAIVLPVELRGEFLKQRCQGDHRLLDEVSSLLRASNESQNFIEDNSIKPESIIFGDEEVQTGRQFGKFRILREIGSGGMGTVFLADRIEGEFSQRVALKIVRQSVTGHEIVERFKRERQILADLNHPNIAALYDGGISHTGEPYIAMEFVEGETLLDFARHAKLSVSERLRLFLKICSAVSYAHRNLVVHRDIKPSNIVVSNEGEPKLLDFGLAKAFGSDASTTRTELRAFTPAYASPEQILGLSITTASDVYSLGVVLYELLSGSKPLDLDNKSYEEIVRTVTDRSPSKPSSVEASGDTSVSRQSLRGDLDNIALMALRKEPERRFKSVDDLAEDIDRHLSGRPITARSNTPGYLTGKFIRRNKVAVASALLIVITLVAGLVISLWQAERIRLERDRAEKRFQDVHQLSNSLLFDISPKLERLPGSIEAREALVAKALIYLDSLAVESQSDPGLLADLAAAYEKVGDLQGNVGRPNLSDFAGAVASFEKARGIRGTLPADTENKLRLANNLKNSSSIRNLQHDVGGGLTEAEEARRIFAELAEHGTVSQEIAIASVEAQIAHAQIYSFNNRYSEAIPLFQNALISLEPLDQHHLKITNLSAIVYAHLANALSWDGRQSEAEAALAVALSISKEIETAYPNNTDVLSTAFQVFMLASSISEETNGIYSQQMANRALLSAKRAQEVDKADSQATYNLARAYSRLGITNANIDRLPDAVSCLERSEEIFTELIDKEPRNVIYQRDLGKLYVRMGDTSDKRLDVPDALLKYQNSAVIFEKISASDAMNTLAKRDLAQSLRSVGKAQIAMSQLSAAKMNLLRAKDILERLKMEHALGAYDEQLIDDVKKALGSI